MSDLCYTTPTSPAWQLTHSLLAIISLYRTATIGIQDPNKDPAAHTRYKENSLVVLILVLLPKMLQLYIGLNIAFFVFRAVMVLVYPAELSIMCPATPPMWLTLAGFTGSVLGVIGTELRLWCYRTLGKYFTFRLAVQADQPLITTGPYTYLRHPAYLGAFLTGLQFQLSVILSNPISLCYGRNLFKYSKELETALLIMGFFPGIAAIVKRMNDEEKMMKTKYGKEYAEWEKRTWRMMPFVY